MGDQHPTASRITLSCVPFSSSPGERGRGAPRGRVRTCSRPHARVGEHRLRAHPGRTLPPPSVGRVPVAVTPVPSADEHAERPPAWRACHHTAAEGGSAPGTELSPKPKVFLFLFLANIPGSHTDHETGKRQEATQKSAHRTWTAGGRARSAEALAQQEWTRPEGKGRTAPTCGRRRVPETERGLAAVQNHGPQYSTCLSEPSVLRGTRPQSWPWGI